MKRLAESDISALEEIYVVFAPKVRSFVTHYIGKEEAEDLTQDIFLKIWQSRNKISSILIRVLDSYIFRISKNYCPRNSDAIRLTEAMSTGSSTISSGCKFSRNCI